jgi:hypothetical protein
MLGVNMSKVSECDNNELLNEFARLHRKDALQDVHQTPFTLEDSERCIQVRGELTRRMPEHGEDSELRTKLKRFLLELNHDYVHKELQQILDSTDAKDSLAPEGETSAVTKKEEESREKLKKQFAHVSDEMLLTFFLEQIDTEDQNQETEYSAYCDRLEAEILRRMSGMPVFPLKPTYEELVKGLSDAIEHLNYCGWGDRWERECAENLRKELPELLKKAQGG